MAMEVACLDMEGVLTPEVWVHVSQHTGIEELKLTTRNIPDYDELMTKRLQILDEHGLKLPDIQNVIAGLDVLDGARDFVDWMRANFQVIILSDTFYDFAEPFMVQLNRPTLFCHQLEVAESGQITAYKLRMPNQKYHAVKAIQALNFTVFSAGDSYNDTTMLNQADFGILFNPPANVIEEFPHLPVTHTYEEMKQAFADASSRNIKV
jgi:phosphoserine/homoserine phosphotransferase